MSDSETSTEEEVVSSNENSNEDDDSTGENSLEIDTNTDSDSEDVVEDKNIKAKTEKQLKKNKKSKVAVDDSKKPEENEIPFNKGKKKGNILEKYENLKGKQLFVRFPKKLPSKPAEVEEYVKNFSELITKVHRPRQKSSRHCLIEFDNENDRAKAMKRLEKVEIEGSKLIVRIPKTENEEFLQKITQYHDKKLTKLFEKKKVKQLAKQKDKTNFTSTLQIKNIPPSATVADVKALAPNAIELKFTLAKGMNETSTASITLPTPKDATLFKRKKHKIGDNNLIVAYAKTKTDGQGKKKKQNLQQSEGAEKEKEEVVSKLKANTNNDTNKKRKLSENSIEQDDEESSPKKPKENNKSKDKGAVLPQTGKKQKKNKINANINANKPENTLNSKNSTHGNQIKKKNNEIKKTIQENGDSEKIKQIKTTGKNKLETQAAKNFNVISNPKKVLGDGFKQKQINKKKKKVGLNK